MWIKSNIYNSSAASYDAYIREIVPSHDKMQNIIIEALSYRVSNKISTLIELGVGTGMLAFNLLSKINIEQYIGYEISDRLFHLAQARLSIFSSLIDLRNKDFVTAKFNNEAAAIVSTMTFHYLSNEAKRVVFGKIYKASKNNGLVIIGDRVISRNNFLQSIFKKRMETSWDETTKNWSQKIRNSHNTAEDPKEEPWYLEDQLEWLRKAGFSDVECIWRDFNYCVFWGIKRKDRR